MPKGQYPRKSRDELFWEKVDQKGPADCWLWTASVNKDGYGQFWIGHTFVPAHRYAWVYRNRKPIPENMIIAHHCDTPACCNPNHLFITDTQGNVKDKMSKGRHSYKTRCKFYSGEVWLMRKLYSHGVSTYKMAPMFKASQSSIYRAIYNLGYTGKEFI